MKNQALYIIKPEAMHLRNKIRDYIEVNSDLVIINTEVLQLNEYDIEEIFIDDKGTPLMKAIAAHLLNRDVEVAIVELPNSDSNEQLINELMSITGLNFVPSRCDENTVRRRFGSDNFELYYGIRYYLNAIHRTGINESKAAIAWYNKNILRFN